MTPVPPVPSVPQAARDLLAVVTLLGLALWGLDDSLSSRSYLAVAAVGLVAVAGLALALLSAERSTALFLLIALPGYVVVGSMTALASFTQVDLPTPSGLVDVLTATITAPVRLLSTIPPVDADDSVLVMPHFLGFVLGGAAVWIALRTRRPALPLIPLLMALAVCILLATEEPQGLVVRGLAFAVVSLAWVASRAADLRPIQHRWPGSGGPRRGRRGGGRTRGRSRLGRHPASRHRSRRSAGAPRPGRLPGRTSASWTTRWRLPEVHRPARPAPTT